MRRMIDTVQLSVSDCEDFFPAMRQEEYGKNIMVIRMAPGESVLVAAAPGPTHPCTNAAEENTGYFQSVMVCCVLTKNRKGVENDETEACPAEQTKYSAKARFY